jgi:Zn-dependent protease
LEGISKFLIMIVPLLFAIVIHEVAHGWMALRFGDTTAKDAGRLTLNPIPHIDPLGSIVVPLLLHFSGTGFLFGWAKPVPVNPYNLRNPRDSMMWVSLAGPGANMLTAFGCGMIIRLLKLMPGGFMMGSSLFGILVTMIAYGMIISLVLACFNMIPIPPLDGSKVLMRFLPPRYEQYMMQLQGMGIFLLIGIIMIGNMINVPILGMIIHPFVSFFSFVFAGGF